MKQAYGPGKFGLSFELFPPKTDAGQQALFRHVGELVEFQPSFITCTYGAGGSTRQKTLDIVTQVKQRFERPVASHLTCVGSSVDQLRAYLTDAAARGVDNIVALRGDPPQGDTEFRPAEDGFSHANELVELIRSEFGSFGIAVAGYPETHQEAPTAAVDLENLHRKVQAGANVVLTQLFYDNRDFFDFRQRYESAGIQTPLIPGILPVTNSSQIKRIASLCGARLSSEFVTELEKKDDPDWQFEVGVAQAVQQVGELIEKGVPGVHFYVLNKSQATSRVLSELGVQGK